VFFSWYDTQDATVRLLTSQSLPEINVIIQVVLETYSTRPFLGYSASFFFTKAAWLVCPYETAPDLIVEYARPRRDAVVTRGGSPDSADTAKSPSPQSPPIRGRYTHPLGF
jgi:hypothetical protein